MQQPITSIQFSQMNSRHKKMIATFALIILVPILLGGYFGYRYMVNRQAELVGRYYMNSLLDGRPDIAYGLTSKNVQNSHTLVDFAAITSSYSSSTAAYGAIVQHVKGHVLYIATIDNLNPKPLVVGLTLIHSGLFSWQVNSMIAQKTT